MRLINSNTDREKALERFREIDGKIIFLKTALRLSIFGIIVSFIVSIFAIQIFASRSLYMISWLSLSLLFGYSCSCFADAYKLRKEQLLIPEMLKEYDARNEETIHQTKYSSSDPINNKNVEVNHSKKKLNYIHARKLVDNYVIFDLNTTGLSDLFDEIIEIGAIKFVNNKEISRFHTYIKPAKSEIDDFIVRLTGITPEKVADAPYIEEISPLFLEFIEGFTLVAHNASFDMGFLFASIPAITPNNYRVIDTLKLARKNMSFLKDYKLKTIKKYLGVTVTYNDAISDCLAISELYMLIKAESKLKQSH